MDTNSYLIALVAALVVFMAASLRAENNRLERKLDAILVHLGVEFPDMSPELRQEIQQLVNQGKKIEAIKLYREQTGAGLKEAKDAVESLPML